MATPAISPVTITGQVIDSSGNLASSGYVDFILQPANQSLNYSVPPNLAIANPSRGYIVAGGEVVQQPNGTSPLVVWPNDLIVPSNSLYQIIIAPNNRVTRIFNGVLITQAVNPQSLAELQFVSPQNQVVGSYVNGNPIITMSVIPGINDVWSIGEPGMQYLNGYFGSVYAETVYAASVVTAGVSAVASLSSDNMFGQPQPGQLVLIYTFTQTAVFPQNFLNPTSYATAGIASTNLVYYLIQRNGQNVGSVTFFPAGTPVFATGGFTVQPGDRLTMIAPNPMDATLSDVAITLAYTIVEEP